MAPIVRVGEAKFEKRQKLLLVVVCVLSRVDGRVDRDGPHGGSVSGAKLQFFRRTTIRFTARFRVSHSTLSLLPTGRVSLCSEEELESRLFLNVD